MIRLKCEYCQQVIAEGGRVADQKTAYYEHRTACKPHNGAFFIPERIETDD